MIDYSLFRDAAASRPPLSRHLTTFLDSRATSSRPALHTTKECVISRLRYQPINLSWKMITSISCAVSLKTWADGLCIILQVSTLSLSCCTTLVPGQTRLCTFISYLWIFVGILFRVPSTCFMLYLDFFLGKTRSLRNFQQQGNTWRAKREERTWVIQSSNFRWRFRPDATFIVGGRVSSPQDVRIAE